MMLKTIRSNFGHPRGFVGQIVGWTLAIQNRERIHWAVSLLDVRPSDHILEIGFGPGVGIERLAAQARAGLVAGIDISDVMVRQASRRNAPAVKEGRVELKQGAAEKLSYADQQFDKVIAINSLHHWSDQQAGLREAHRVLKSGGVITIVEQPPSKVTEEAEIKQRGNEIRALLIESGFKDVETIYATLERGMSVFVRGRR
jgi:ubiquinone/menaquinone biosynthesis C-methylase UbiE